MNIIKHREMGKKEDKKLVLWLLLLLIPHFEPGYFNNEQPLIDLLFNIGRVLSALYIIYYFIERKKRISLIMIVWILLQAWSFTNTLFQVGLTKDILITTVSMIIGCLIIECYAKTHVRELIHALLIIYEILIYCNFITMLLFPKGLYVSDWQWENWLLGFRNSFTVFFVPALAISMIWNHYTGNTYRLLFLFVVCIASTILGHSATCLVTILVMTGLYFFRIYRLKIINAVSVTIGYLLAFFGIVIFRVTDHMGSFIEQLGRKTTLSGRTFIWDTLMEMIANRFIIGYGKQESDFRATLVQKAYAAINAHNFILEHLYCGGIIQLTIVILFFILIIVILQKQIKFEITRLLIMGYSCILLIFLVEAGYYMSIYTFLFLCAYSKQVCEQCRPVAKRKTFRL